MTYTKFTTERPTFADDQLWADLTKNKVTVTAEPVVQHRSFLANLLIALAPMLLLVVLWIFSPCAMSPPEAGGRARRGSAVAPPFASAPVSSSPPPHAVRARARAATGAARRRAVLRCGTTGSCMQMCLFPRTVDQG
ncbi:hypothetical protein STENM327S_00168 [Streptomyces tendae]